MKMERTFRIGSKVALISAIALAVVGLLFRSFVWASWPPQGDDPYGPSDILETVIFFLIILFGLICTVAGVALLFLQQRTWKILAAGITVPAAYVWLHSLVPIFKFW